MTGAAAPRRSSKDGLALAALLGPIALLWFGLALSGSSFFWGDLTYLHHPWRALAAQLIQAGRLPLWNPYAYSGMPLAAQLQSAVWYPASATFNLFPFPAGLVLFQAGHCLLAALFSFLWLRKEGFRRSAAFAGAALFAGSGFLVSRIPFINIFSTLSYLPALLLFGRGPWLLGLALAMAFLSGYPTILAGGAAAAFLLTWALGREAAAGAPLAGLKARAKVWLPAAGLAAGGSALLLLPAAALALQSHRGAGLGLADTLRFGFELPDLAQFLSPLAVPEGAFDPAAQWWKACYVGFLASGLAGLGACRLRPAALAVMAAYLAGVVLLVLGGSNPVSLWLWSHAPVLRYIRYPGNVSYLVLPAAMLLAAAGLDAAKPAVAAGSSWRRLCFSRPAAAVLAGLLALELGAYAVAFSGPTVPSGYFTDAGPLARRLQADLGSHRYLLSPRALQWHRGAGPDTLSAALDLKHRLYGVCNSPYRLEAAGNFGEPLVPAESYRFMDALFSARGIDEAARLLPWADVRVLLTREALPTALLAYEGGDLWQAYSVLQKPARAVWLDEEAGLAVPAGVPDAGAAASVLPDLSRGLNLSMERPREDRFKVRAWTEAGWVYVAEPRGLGWKAWLNGGRVFPEPAMGPFQKLRVPEGKWELDAVYDPTAWRAGLWLSAAVLLAAAAYWYNRASS